MKHWRFAFLILVGICFNTATFSQTFVYKDDDGVIQKLDLSFRTFPDQSIQLKKPELLQMFSGANYPIKTSLISREDPSEAEQAVHVALMILMGLTVITTEDAYTLSDTLRMTSVHGLFFFIFPFEFHHLYRRCGPSTNTVEYLVAVSDNPSEETIKELRSLKEIESLCAQSEDHSS